MKGQSTPLSPGEKTHLARLARDAWAMLKRAGAIDQNADDWRRDQSLQAIGKRISEATKADFITLKAHFLAMAGKTGAAFNAAMQHPTANEVRQALWHLDKELAKHQLDRTYPATIANAKYKTRQLESLTSNQIWSLIFDIRRNKSAIPNPQSAMV
jgi:hypothetical protein